MNDELKLAAAHWSKPSAPQKVRWWQSPTILRHINRLLCGRPISGGWSGFNERLRNLSADGTFQRGISVGCGVGSKEINLVKANFVQSFDLFEISEKRVEQGRLLAIEHGVAERVTFHIADAFSTALDHDYDLVYWNNSLHHMLDAEAAIAWSKARLRYGGYFAMDDFVGPSRFQWSDYNLEIASSVRKILPPEYLVDPLNPDRKIPVEVRRPDIDRLIAQDPTEAADSERILPILVNEFPGCEICLTGGCIYHLALSNVLYHFNEVSDLPLLQSLLLLDEALAKMGETHYAVAFAKR